MILKDPRNEDGLLHREACAVNLGAKQGQLRAPSVPSAGIPAIRESPDFFAKIVVQFAVFKFEFDCWIFVVGFFRFRRNYKWCGSCCSRFFGT